MIKAGIFDVGGVLVDWNNIHIIRDVSRTLELDEKTVQRTWDELIPLVDSGKITEDEFWQRFIRLTHPKLPLPQKSFFLREFEKKFSPIQGTIDIVRKLKAKNFILAILSNTIESHVRFLKEKGIYEDFSIFMFSHEVKVSKPNSAIYLQTVEKLALKPQVTFFVDDRLENVEAAANVGIHAIHFQNPEGLMKDLQALGIDL